MAKFLDESRPEPTFKFQLTQSEILALQSVLTDLAEDKRGTATIYLIDEDITAPTEDVKEKVNSVLKVLNEAVPWTDDYDHFDYITQINVEDFDWPKVRAAAGITWVDNYKTRC